MKFPRFEIADFCQRRSIIVVLVCASISAGCATSPLGRSQLQLFDEATMAEMGAAAFENLKNEGPDEADPATVRYVRCVADRIIAALPQTSPDQWQVRVIQEDSANAFALPGGYIGVHTGLLEPAENQHQLATVMGHEVAHVLADHANERVSTRYAADAGLQLVSALAIDGASTESRSLMALLGAGTEVGVLLPFSRAQEREADILGLELMAKAGFDPDASIALWQNMAALGQDRPPAFLSTHPGPESRISVLRSHLQDARRMHRTALESRGAPACQ